MYDKEKLHALLTSMHKTVDDAGKVLPPSNPVYTTIAHAMMEQGCACNISNVTKTSVNKTADVKKFRVVISADQWTQIQPERSSKKTSGRKYVTLHKVSGHTFSRKKFINKIKSFARLVLSELRFSYSQRRNTMPPFAGSVKNAARVLQDISIISLRKTLMSLSNAPYRTSVKTLSIRRSVN